AIVNGDPDQDVFRGSLRVFHEDIKVAILIEDAGVEKLVLEPVSAAFAIRSYDRLVGESSLRVLVQILHVRMRRRRIEIEVVLLDVLAVVTLTVCEAEQPFLEDGIFAIPKGEREAQQLPLVGNARETILAPAIGP